MICRTLGARIYLWIPQTKPTMFTNEISYNEDIIELWKTQTYRRKVMDDMSNNKDTVGSLEYTHIIIIIIIIILESAVQGRVRVRTLYQSKDPTPHDQPMEGRKR